jgi:hypothetical protein
MKGNRNVVRMLSGRWALFLLLAAVLTPIAVQAACMDILTCSVNYIYNDTQKQTLKAATIDYHPAIASAVTTRIECSEVGDGTTDLTCSPYMTYAYVYIVKSNGTKKITNPGWSQQGTGSLCEKICNSMGIAVYYLNGGPL